MNRLKLLLVAAFWLLLTRLALDRGALLLPASLARGLTLEAFLSLAQLITTAVGVGLCALVLGAVRAPLGLRGGTARSLVAGLLAATPVFLVAMAAGIAVALPTLLAELHAGGAAVSQKNVGELGRSLAKSSLGMTLLWATVAAPLAEEILFRGVVWSAFRALFAAPPPQAVGDAAAQSLPPELIDDGVLVKAARRLGAGLRSGGLATLASAAVFGAMHLGMPGGSGIVRVVSATCLGLACGLARHLGGSLAAPLALHAVYNLVSVGHARGWFLSETFPAKFALPTLVMLLALLSSLALALFLFVTRARAPRLEAGPPSR
jgi:membrane protease YdiL (CAAX protease family)